MSFLCIQSNILTGQWTDTLYKIPNNPLVSKIISLKNENLTINLSKESELIPLKNTILGSNAQKLYKKGNELFVSIEQTGFIFQLVKYDSISCVFRRLDKTINLNYNINCKTFFYKNELYSYGGYGFWKSNGSLRKFNFQDQEWDIIPLNEEIIASNYLWFSEEQGRLYVPFQRIINAGIDGAENVTGKTLFSSYYLDVASRKWIKLGDLESEIISLVKNDNTSNEYLSYKNGLLHRVNEDTYLFDYVHNKIYKSKNPDLNQFLIRRHQVLDMFIDNNEIYSYNASTKSIVVYPFKIDDFELLRSSIWGSETQLFYLIIALVFIILVIITSFWIFNRTVKRKLEQAQLAILKNKSISQAFTPIEVSLIKLLLSFSLKNKTVEIHHINHTLGLKDKNVGLQKKVRSDVVKSINEKYEFITQSKNLLIGSSRKIDDKRYFEYFITSSEINAIQRIIEKN
jgi:hypothetical protein